jgi:hypothetical protein
VATVLPPSLAVQDVALLLGKCGLSQEEDGKRGQVSCELVCCTVVLVAGRLEIMSVVCMLDAAGAS